MTDLSAAAVVADGEPAPAVPSGSQPAAEAEPAPIGTLTILALYLVVIIGLWGTIYLTLLARG